MSNSINGRGSFIPKPGATDAFSTPVARKGDAAALPKPEQAPEQVAPDLKAAAPTSDVVHVSQVASFASNPPGVARVQQQGLPAFDQMYQEWRKKTPGASDKLASSNARDKPPVTEARDEYTEGFWSALQAGWKRVQR